MSTETKKSNSAKTQETTPVVLHTDVNGLILRQMITEHDDEQYFEFQNRNIDHIAEFGNSIDKSIAEVTRRRLEHGGDGRFGIWFEGRLVGMIGYSTKGHEREAEIGILLDKDSTGRGLATASVKTLTEYAKSRFERVFAEVEPNNTKSIILMNRAGYQTNGEIVERDWGKALVFEAPK